MSLEHPLLDAPAQRYSTATMERAFIVWLYCGRRNEFTDVANYYHRLEQMEAKLPADQRQKSMQYELDLYKHPPPVSSYVQSHYPNLYIPTKIDNKAINDIRKEFDSNKTLTAEGATIKEIVTASQLITNYCLEYKVELKDFLLEFQDYTDKHDMRNTVTNIIKFIKIKAAIKDCDKAYSRQSVKKVNMETKEDQRTILAERHEPNAETVKNGDFNQQNQLFIGVRVYSPKEPKVVVEADKLCAKVKLLNECSLDKAAIDKGKENVNEINNGEDTMKLTNGCNNNVENDKDNILGKTSNVNGNLSVERNEISTLQA